MELIPAIRLLMDRWGHTLLATAVGMRVGVGMMGRGKHQGVGVSTVGKRGE